MLYYFITTDGRRAMRAGARAAFFSLVLLGFFGGAA
jgi:hypothetical protein